MRHKHCMTWKTVRNSQKRRKGEIHTLEPGLWRKTEKNVENETQILFDLECVTKKEKRGK